MKKVFFSIALLSAIRSFSQTGDDQKSPIIPIILKVAVPPPTIADAKDRLLWYKGKKVNDSTLITTDAKLVLYSQPRNMVVVQLKNDPTMKIANELAKTEKRKEEFYNRIAENKSGVLFYPAIVSTLNEFDDIADKYGNAIKNKIDLPLALTGTVFQKSKFRSGGVAHVKMNYIFSIPEYIKKAYLEVMEVMKNYPPIDFPAPPASDFSACSSFNCDSVARKKNDASEAEWLRAFTEYEAGIIQRSLSIIKKIHELGLEKDAEAEPIFSGLDKAIQFAFARASNKADLLIRKYGNDFSRLPSVARAALAIERQKQLMGMGDNSSYISTITKLKTIFDGFDKFMEQQMDARNYDIVLNLSFVLGMERQKQLLGIADTEDMKSAWNHLDKLKAFNRFRLDVQYDYKGEWKGCGIEKANFTAPNLEPIYVQLGLINCRYNFFIAEEYVNAYPNGVHYGNAYHFELKVTNGTGTESKSSEDGENCWQIQHDLKGLIIRPYEPIVSLSFCEIDTKDSLQFYALHLPVSRENREDIRYNYANFAHFDERIQHDGFENETPRQIEEYQMELEELKQNRLGLPEMKPFAKPDIKEMEQLHFETNRAKWLRARINEYEEGNKSSVIVFDAKNGSPVIVDEKTTKQYSDNTSEGEIYEKADVTIRVKITHEPLPYKTTPKK